MRHLILSALIVHDHLVHFYHLHGLDWIDMAAALSADPSKAGKLIGQMSGRGNNPADLYIVQKRIKEFVDGGQLGFLENAYFLGGNPAYRLSPEENLILSAHYFEGLRVQLELGRAMALFAGKNPHAQSMVVGGMTCYDSLTQETIDHFRNIWTLTLEFAENAMMTDILLLAKAHPEAREYGKTSNFFDFSDFKDPETGKDPYFSSGVMWKNNLKAAESLNMDEITEHVAHSWYKGSTARPPTRGKRIQPTPAMKTGKNTPGPRPQGTRASLWRPAPWPDGPLPMPERRRRQRPFWMNFSNSRAWPPNNSSPPWDGRSAGWWKPSC